MKLTPCQYFNSLENVISLYVNGGKPVPREVLRAGEKIAGANLTTFNAADPTHQRKLIDIFSNSAKWANKEVRDRYIVKEVSGLTYPNMKTDNAAFFNTYQGGLVRVAQKFYHKLDTPNNPLALQEQKRNGQLLNQRFESVDDRINFVLDSPEFINLFGGDRLSSGITMNLDGATKLDVKMLHLANRALSQPKFAKLFAEKLVEKEKNEWATLKKYLADNGLEGTPEGEKAWANFYKEEHRRENFINNSFFLKTDSKRKRDITQALNGAKAYSRDIQEVMIDALIALRASDIHEYNAILNRQMDSSGKITQDKFGTKVSGHSVARQDVPKSGDPHDEAGTTFREGFSGDAPESDLTDIMGRPKTPPEHSLFRADSISLEDVIMYKFLEFNNPKVLSIVKKYEDLGNSAKRVVDDLSFKDTGHQEAALRPTDDGLNPIVLNTYFSKYNVRQKFLREAWLNKDVVEQYHEKGFKSLDKEGRAIIRKLFLGDKDNKGNFRESLFDRSALNENEQHLDMVFDPRYERSYKEAQKILNDPASSALEKEAAHKSIKSLRPYMEIRALMLRAFNMSVNKQNPLHRLPSLQEDLAELTTLIQQRVQKNNPDLSANDLSQLVYDETEKQLSNFLIRNKESMGLLIHFGKDVPIEQLITDDSLVTISDRVKAVVANKLQEVINPEVGLALWGKRKELAQELANTKAAKNAIISAGEAMKFRGRQITRFKGKAVQFATQRRQNLIAENNAAIRLNTALLNGVQHFRQELTNLAKQYKKTESAKFVKPYAEARLTQLHNEKTLWRSKLTPEDRQKLAKKGFFKNKHLNYGKQLNDEIKLIEDAIKTGDYRLALGKMLQSLGDREKRLIGLIDEFKVKDTRLNSSEYNPQDYNDHLKKLKEDNPNKYTPDFIGEGIIKAIKEEDPKFAHLDDHEIAEALTWHVWTGNPLQVQGISSETDFVWHDFTRLDSQSIGPNNLAKDLYTEKFGMIPQYISAKRIRLPEDGHAKARWVAYTPDGRMLMTHINGLKVPYVFSDYDDFHNFSLNVKSAINKSLQEEQNTISAAVNFSTPYFGIVTKNKNQVTKHFSETNVIELRMPKDGTIENDMRRAKNSGLKNSFKGLVHNDQRKAQTMTFNLIYSLGWTPVRVPGTSILRFERRGGLPIPPRMGRVVGTEGLMSLKSPNLAERFVARSSDSYNKFGYSIDNVRRQRNIMDWTNKYVKRTKDGEPYHKPGFNTSAVKTFTNKNGDAVFSLNITGKDQHWLQNQVAGLSGPYFRPRGTLMEQTPEGEFVPDRIPQNKTRGVGIPTGGKVHQPGPANKSNRAKPFLDTRPKTMDRRIFGKNVKVSPVYGELNWLSEHPIIKDYMAAAQGAQEHAALIGGQVNVFLREDGTMNLVVSKPEYHQHKTTKKTALGTDTEVTQHRAPPGHTWDESAKLMYPNIAMQDPLNAMLITALKKSPAVSTLKFSDLRKIFPDQEPWIKVSFGKETDKFFAENDITVVSAKTKYGVVVSMLNPSKETSTEAFDLANELIDRKFNRTSVLDDEAIFETESIVNSLLEAGEFEEAVAKVQGFMQTPGGLQSPLLTKPKPLMTGMKNEYLEQSFGAVQTFFIPDEKRAKDTFELFNQTKDIDLAQLNTRQQNKNKAEILKEASAVPPEDPEAFNRAAKDFIHKQEEGLINTPHDAVSHLLVLGEKGFQENSHLKTAIRMIKRFRENSDEISQEAAEDHLEMLLDIPDAGFQHFVKEAIDALNIPESNIAARTSDEDIFTDASDDITKTTPSIDPADLD